MNRFLEMLREVELNRQDDCLARMVHERIVCFLPSINKESFQNDVNMVRQLYGNGFNISAVCMFDEFMHLLNKVEVDFPVIPVSELNNVENKGNRVIITYSKFAWPNAMYRYFERLGMEPFFIWDSEYLRSAIDYHWSYITNLYDVYKGLADDMSREAYLGIIKGKMMGQPQKRVYASEPQYMLHGFTPFDDCIAIDGGAFDGESARTFTEMGADVYSFELDSENFKTVEEKSRKYNFHAVNKGLWSSRKTGSYMMGGAASSVFSDGNGTAELIDIDTFVSENDLSRVDYIKLDVEGSELEVLKGASMSISKWKPILAISAYHRNEDLWVLYDYIKSLRPDYEFAFRYYRIDSRNYYLDDFARKMFNHYDLELMVPTPWEYVLYAR